MKRKPKGGLDSLRARIDSVDSRILELLDERAKLATAVGEEKRRIQREASTPDEAGPKPVGFYDPEREQRILGRLMELHAKSRGEGGEGGLFPEQAIPFVFREVISACRSLEAAMRIGFLGPAGTFTQIAARQTFGSSVDYVEAPTIEGVFEAVFRGRADYGVVPYENSAEGGVLETLEALLRMNLSVRSEVILRIDHYLVSRNTDLSAIRKVHSHPAAIAQSALWLSKNLPGIPTVAARSTAAAARSAAEDPTSAAIASRISAEIFGLNILRERIQDQVDNATRFLVLSHSDGPVTGNDRTSIIVSLKDDRDLGKALRAFDAARIRVSRVESRASAQRSWHYHYFLDFPGHRQEPRVAAVLKKVSRLCEGLKIIGSYPRFQGWGRKDGGVDGGSGA